jgi:hypothetical protein
MTSGWFVTLTAPQLKELLAAAMLPVSGTKAVKVERLLVSSVTSVYNERDDGASDDEDRYATVLRLLLSKTPRAVLESVNSNAPILNTTAALDSSAMAKAPPAKKARTVKVLEGTALEKRVQHRLKKINKQIGDRLKWKSSFKCSQEKVMGGRVDVDCPEPEVFQAMFGIHNIKTNKSTGKMTRSFSAQDDFGEAEIYGKSYRFGAHASLQGPGSASLHEGKLVVSFKYTVRC